MTGKMRNMCGYIVKNGYNFKGHKKFKATPEFKRAQKRLLNLKNEYHVSRMKFGDFKEKIF
jgi:hypothetical protein